MLPSVGSFSKQGGGEGRYGADGAKQLPNLIIVSLEVLFPLNDHFLSQRDRELVNMYRVKMGKVGHGGVWVDSDLVMKRFLWSFPSSYPSSSSSSSSSSPSPSSSSSSLERSNS